GPGVRLRPGRFGGNGEGKSEVAPKKLSEMLRLEVVKVFDGRVTYDDGTPNTPPMVWDGLAIDMATDQQSSPSAYTFHAVSRAIQTADLAVGGAFDVDSLVFDVQTFSA